MLERRRQPPRHFDRTIIILCVRWYTTYKLGYRDLVEMMAERGVILSHTTILRWVQRYVPEFEKRWRRYARPVTTSWRMDETYIRVRGRWTYLYCAVDKHGLTVDFLLSERRDIAAAKRFFTRAVQRPWRPGEDYARRISRQTRSCRGVEGEWGDAVGDEGLDE